MGVEKKIGERNSSSDLFCCIHFLIKALEKAVDEIATYTGPYSLGCDSSNRKKKTEFQTVQEATMKVTPLSFSEEYSHS